MSRTMYYLQKVEKEFKDEKYANLVFRGQKNYDWPITSSAARRLEKSKNTSQSEFIKYHEILLKDARDGNYSDLIAVNESIAEMSDMELLANIQHFGGATCLTDFTANFLIALWFATESNQVKEPDASKECETDGAIFVINLKQRKNKNMFVNFEPYAVSGEKYGYTVKNDIVSILTYNCGEKKKEMHFWYWKTKNMNSRIHQQNSVFVFGLPPLLKDFYLKIKIVAKNKPIIREELKDYFNIDADTVFPDFHGFCSDANKYGAPLNRFFHMDCTEIAESYLEEGNYRDCMRYLDKMIHCRKEEGNRCDRERDVKKSCSKDIVLPNAYFLKGKCIYLSVKDELKHKEQADKWIIKKCIERFNEAFELFEKALREQCYYSNECMSYLIKIVYDIGRINPAGPEEMDQYYDHNISKILNLAKENSAKLQGKAGTDQSNSDIYIEYCIVEWSLFAHQQESFVSHMQIIKNRIDKDNQYINRDLLYDFFKAVGDFMLSNEANESLNNDVTIQYEMPFKQRMKEKLDEIKQLYKNNELKKEEKLERKNKLVDILDRSIYWDFDDMLYWLETNRAAAGNDNREEQKLHADKIDRLIKYIKDVDAVQEIWQEIYFDNNTAFDESRYSKAQENK